MSPPLSRRVAPRLFVASALLLAACGGGGGGGGGGPSGFHVASTSPASGAVLVPVDAHVVVSFSDALDANSVGVTAVAVGLPGSGAVSGALLFSSPGALEFVPGRDLDPSTTYAVQVSPSLRSITGSPIVGSLSFLFRTSTASGGGITLPRPDQLRETNFPLHVGRRSHTATLLTNGQVLIAGGISVGTFVTATAERYSPSAEQFTQIASMNHPREGHVAVRLLDGRVLLAGGWYEVSSGVLNADASAEVFNPTTNTFTDVGSMTFGRGDAAGMLLPDGRVLVTGGTRPVGAGFEDFSTAEVFDPATNLWSAWPAEMNLTHTTHSATNLGDGRFLIAGGFELPFELFTVSTGVFTELGVPVGETARVGGCTASFADGDVVVCGGDNLGSVSYFDREASVVIATGSRLTGARSYATASPIAPDRVLVAGGIDFAAGSAILTTCDLVVQGGVAGSRTYATQVKFPVGIANHTATVLLDGKVLFVGGLNPVGGAPEQTAAYLFTP